MTEDGSLRSVPFIYDARRKVATLRGQSRDGGAEIVIELVERHDDDSHTARLFTEADAGFMFRLTEDDIAFTDSSVRLRLPETEIYLDPVYVRKFKAFTRGNVPTPDVAGETLP